MEIERKDVLAEVKSLDDKGEGILRFIRFNQEDKDSDITLPGFVGQQEAILISAHNWTSDYPPLGRGESFEDDGSTNFRFRLNLDDERARSWHSWLTLDRQFKTPLQQVSYGFSVHPDGMEYGQKDGRRVRYLKPRPDGPGAKLHEISFVTVGSGNDTAILALKSAPTSPAARRFYVGGLTPMKGVKEHVSEAVTSVRSSLRHFQHARQMLGDIPMTAKTQRLGEFLDAGIDELDTGMVSMETGMDRWQEVVSVPSEVTPPPSVPVKAVDPSPVVVTPPDEPLPDEDGAEREEVSETEQKWSMKDQIDRVMTDIAHVAEALENTKRKRASSSERYPNGRPLAADRLKQVEQLMVRLSRLKVAEQSREHSEQQETVQREMDDMAERFKRLGASV